MSLSKGIARRLTITTSGIVLAVAAALALSTSASAATSVCAFGSGSGQCERPRGLAVDRTTGRLYVADSENNRVNVFDSDGGFLMAFGWGVADGTTGALQTCTAMCFRGIAGVGAGQLSAPRSIAVDNDPLSPAQGNVYVLDGNSRVQRFSSAGGFVLAFADQLSGPITVGSGGAVYVADRTPPGSAEAAEIKQFTPLGALVGSPVLAGSGYLDSLEVDSGGDAYVIRDDTGTIEKFELTEPTAIFLASLAANSPTTALAIDTDDNLFAAQGEEGIRVITKYDSTGSAISRFGNGEIEFSLKGLAVSSAADGIFAAEEYVGLPTPGNRVLSIPFPPPGPLPCCVEASPVSNTKTTLKAKVNPQGKATTYHFDYVDKAGFEASGFSGPTVRSTPETAVGSDLSLHAVSDVIGCPVPQSPPQASCLQPSTLYHFRLVASNADAPAGVIEEGTPFATLPPLEIKDTFSSEVGTDAARLSVTINPLGIPATGYFEYVDDASFQASGFADASQVPDVAGGEAPVDLGSAEADNVLSRTVSGLGADTTYHYRFVAFDSFAPPEGIPGPIKEFHTYPLPAATATDCPNQAFRSGPSANLPDCRAYEMVSPVQKGNADIAVLFSGLNFPAGLDQSAIDGDQLTYSSQRAFGDAVAAPYTSQYVATRVEGVGWSSHGISAPREPGIFSDIANARFDVEYKAFAPDLSSGWFLHGSPPVLDTCAAPGFPNLYRRDDMSEGYEALTTAKPTNEGAGQYWPELQGLSADGTHAIFRANGKLTKDASGATINQKAIYQLYEHVAGPDCGELRLVSVLPSGKASPETSSAGGGGALSAEGRTQFVTGAVSDDGSRIVWTTFEGGDPVIYMRIEGKETVKVASTPAVFKLAAADGSRVVYTQNGALYEFEVASETQTLIAKGSADVAAASEDASRIYFVSEEALGGKGSAGKRNLYLREHGVGNRFVATLSDDDRPINEFLPISIVGGPTQRGTRATPDGDHLAFLSSASLTGYDNNDAEEGRPTFELYLYDAGTTGKLACVSCQPSGARPAGREFKGVGGQTRRVAALLPDSENQLYSPRALSDDGNRLFFNSFVSLVPRDTNGAADVYQWERAQSTEQCEELGAELFVEAAGGCLSLISSGKSASDSEVVDVSPNGSDVFIKTSSSLLPQDPGLVDIYDARVNGGFAQPPAPPAACEGEACQGPVSPPDDSTPASSAFQGAGNVKDPPPPRCTKPQTRRNGRCTKPGRPRCAKGKVRRSSRCVEKREARSPRTDDHGRTGR